MCDVAMHHFLAKAEKRLDRGLSMQVVELARLSVRRQDA